MHSKADNQKDQTYKNCPGIHLLSPFWWSLQPYQAHPMPNSIPSQLAGCMTTPTKQPAPTVKKKNSQYFKYFIRPSLSH